MAKMRTDRNNNPTAMTTDVAKSLGLKEGVDFVRGDVFPDNPNLFTARLIGNPVATTTKALDIAASTGRGAFYTQGGKQRWTHTALSDEEWQTLQPEAKKKVIAAMYQKEGGSGELMKKKTYKVKFDNGKTVVFDNKPTPQDVEYVAQKLNIQPTKQPPIDEKVTPKTSYVSQISEKGFFAPITGKVRVRDVIREAANTLLSAEIGLGKTLGGALAGVAYGKKIEASNQKLLDSGSKMAELALSQKDPKKKDKYLKMAKQDFQQAGVNWKDIVPEIQKTNKQILGEALGGAVDIATLGTFGAGVKAVAKTGKLLTKPALQGAEKLITKETIPTALGQFKPGLKAITAGALGGYGMDVGTKLQYGEEKPYMPGVGTLLGAGIPVLGTAGSKISPVKAQKRFINNLNNVFKKGTQTIKKMFDFAESKGINLGEEIANRNIKVVVDNERLKFNIGSLDILDKDIIEKSNIIDDLTKTSKSQYTADELKELAIKKIKNNKILANEGRTLDVTKQALDKIDDFVAQTNKSYFTLNELQNFKKGMWAASKKFKPTEVGKSDAYSELGSVFKDIIEDEFPDVAIKNINKEIGKAEELYKFINKVNGLQDGGIVLKGGKLGKYFTDIIGTVGGGVLGNLIAPGPLGIAIGGVTGHKLSTILRNLSQKSSVLGIIDGILIKFAKQAPESIAIKEAKLFLEAVKSGKNPTPSPRVLEIFKNIFKEQPLLLKAPSLQLPERISKEPLGKTLAYPSRTEIGKEATIEQAQKAAGIYRGKNLPARIPGRSYEGGGSINLPEKIPNKLYGMSDIRAVLGGAALGTGALIGAKDGEYISEKVMPEIKVRKNNKIETYKVLEEGKMRSTYYDPLDPKQTRPNTDGTGAYGRLVEWGDLATNKYPKDTMIFIEELKNYETPFGMGIFRVNDTMNPRFKKTLDIAIPPQVKNKKELEKIIGNNKFNFRVIEKK
jgi:hypothetical protein